jgi:MazG C-terminal domain
MSNITSFFDSIYDNNEQLPRDFFVSFDSLIIEGKAKVKISIDNNQIGDIIDDNSLDNDFYRYHDVFHYTFATMLGWSPCTRAMMKRKRKSNCIVDENEDGARATITEESIALLVFNKAKKNDYFRGNMKIPTIILNLIKEMTEPYEVSIRTKREWKNAISKGYFLFNLLVDNNGGKIHFDMINQTASFKTN